MVHYVGELNFKFSFGGCTDVVVLPCLHIVSVYGYLLLYGKIWLNLKKVNVLRNINI